MSSCLFGCMALSPIENSHAARVGARDMKPTMASLMVAMAPPMCAGAAAAAPAAAFACGLQVLVIPLAPVFV